MGRMLEVIKLYWKTTWISRIIRNYKKRGLKDITNPDKQIAFLTGELIKKEGITIKVEDIQAYAEQVVYRRYFCECAEMSHCRHCTCEQPISFFTPKFECSQDNYGEMHTTEEWEKFKKEHEIKLLVKSKHDKDVK